MTPHSLSRKSRFRFWLLGLGFFIVLLSVMLLSIVLLTTEHVLSSATVRETVQQMLVARTGIAIGYEKIGIDYFPSPTLALHQLTFSLPDRLQGKADTIRITPNITDLLTGKLNVGMVALERPDISLNLPEPLPFGHPPGSKELDISFASVLHVLPVLNVHISDGRFSLASGTRKAVGEHLELTLKGAVENISSGRGSLKMGLGELAFHEGARVERIKGVELRGDIRALAGSLTCRLKRLAVVEPALTLVGELTMPQAAKDITLRLSGTNIDVGATRKTAHALAGDISPVTEIFTYLAGGTIPQITFSSQGTSLAELGDLANIRLDGHLQDGAVSIPEIAMQLTEVSGDVTIADGVLAGTGLLARLDGSTGHAGMLKIGLAEDDDRFQMELMLDADLGQVPRIVKPILEKPEFDSAIDRLSNLKGTGAGKLVLGDHLSDLHVRLEDADINLSFIYQGVPYPISLTKGRVNYSNDQIELRGGEGTVGASALSGLGVTANWAKKLHLDISAERCGLVLDELYPWLNSMQGVRILLKDFKDISGRLDLSSASFVGDVDAPQPWNYSAAGSLRGVLLKTNRFPGTIRLARGNVALDPKQVTVHDLAAAGLDANLTLDGSVIGVSAPAGRKIDLTVNGTAGKDAVAWLEDTLKLPKEYAVRAPVTLKDTRVSWQADKALSISGGMSVKDGPRLNLDLHYRPEELKVEKLTVNDQYSDAALTYVVGRDGLGVGFNGRLRSETLAGVFVNPKWGKGSLEGDVSLNLPKDTETGASAKGQLKGVQIVLPLDSGDEVSIGQVLLKANGSRVQADATTLSWRDLTWSPLRTTITSHNNKIAIKLDQAALCGIDSPGVVNIDGKNVGLDVTLQGKNLGIRTSYTCLTQGRVKMTGKMDFFSHLKAKGEVDELISKLQGPLKMTFSNGIIEQDRVLSMVLEVLNVTEIVKGRLPDLAATGFKYTLITVEGQFKDGKLIFDKLFMDGETLDILGYGEIDLEKETLNLELLAAPFKTVDTIIKYIPGVNYLMGGSLVVIPVSVKGALADPEVSVMSPSSVSKSLLNLGERTIKLPYKVIESIITGGKGLDK
jgi:hypothetical protein